MTAVTQYNYGGMNYEQPEQKSAESKPSESESAESKQPEPVRKQKPTEQERKIILKPPKNIFGGFYLINLN